MKEEDRRMVEVCAHHHIVQACRRNAGGIPAVDSSCQRGEERLLPNAFLFWSPSAVNADNRNAKDPTESWPEPPSVQ